MPALGRQPTYCSFQSKLRSRFAGIVSGLDWLNPLQKKPSMVAIWPRSIMRIKAV